MRRLVLMVSGMIVAARFFMRLLILIVLITLCGCKGRNDSAEHADNTSDTVTLGFYNVENLFDLNFDGTEYPEYRPGALGWDKQMQAKKLDNIAAVIAAMQADMLGLCEIENRNALEQLRKRLWKLGCEYRYAAIADHPFTNVTNPALLSRFPILRKQSVAVNAYGLTRNILEADVSLDGTVLTLFVNHWPSKAYPESRRLAAATALVARLRALPAGTAYSVIGDLNADDDEWRTFHTQGLDDTKGMTGINHMLGTRADSAGNVWHYDPWQELTAKSRFSTVYKGQPQTPDHILLPPSLLSGGAVTYLENSFSVFTFNGKLLRAGVPLRWQMRGKRRFHAGEGYSDHLPIRAALLTGAAARAVQKRAAPDTAGDGARGGWVACSPGFSVSRDSVLSCLRVEGFSPDRNCCAMRTVVSDGKPDSRRIAFDIRGSGRLSVRIRSGRGAWQYYNWPSFMPSRSARYSSADLTSWRSVSLPCPDRAPSSPDIEIEFRAGRGAPFVFSVANFRECY
ncbi:MAG: endonuclease/exonuclease/phosphatase family protein [Chitinispirillaceae bacterium]|nr:endonuclease/exonuclease/phosphatase family protein [Chitinispirillaceae bacterium]